MDGLFPQQPADRAPSPRSASGPIAFRHERGAVMAADGFSRISDRQRFGVVAVQCQAGAENAMGGLAQAYADNIPILVLARRQRLDQLAVRPNFSAVQHCAGPGQAESRHLYARSDRRRHAARLSRPAQWSAAAPWWWSSLPTSAIEEVPADGADLSFTRSRCARRRDPADIRRGCACPRCRHSGR